MPLPRVAERSDTYLFFYGAREKYGPFSQWYHSNFTVKAESFHYLRREENKDFPLHEQMKFNTAEQYMMFSKTFYFNDPVTAEQIMEAKNPRDQKQLGRLTANFKEDEWNTIREQVVEEGNWAKFTQNAELEEILMSTGDKILVEASKQDRIWGIGFYAKDAMANQRRWGLNLLGKSLIKVRERIDAMRESGTAAKRN
jgi:ribA/ribD-fused uncharacterized protein